MNVDPDFYELNLHYLLKAQQLAQNGQQAQACFRFGLTQADIECLLEVPLAYLRRIARSGLLCYQPRLPRPAWRRLFAKPVDEEELTEWLLFAIFSRQSCNDRADRAD